MSKRDTLKADAGEPAARSQTDQAFAAIKRAIIRCELRPGQQVTEGELAASYGGGRAAVRAALQRLDQEGLVQVAPRKGYLVAPITLKHVNDLFQLRAILEPPAMRLAAGQVDVAALRHLAPAAPADAPASGREAVERFLRANTAFHREVVRATGNERLAALVGGLLVELERIYYLGLDLHQHLGELYHEHDEIIDALARADGARVEQLAAQQIAATHQLLLDSLLQSPTLQSINLAIIP